MAVIHPRISHKKSKRSGKEVLKDMRRLLNNRFFYRVSRRKFLNDWAALRDELRNTPEYRAFCAEVRARARGLCERCGKLGHVVHHKKPVAQFLHLVFKVSNGEYLCRPCHVEEHPWLRKKDDNSHR